MCHWLHEWGYIISPAPQLVNGTIKSSRIAAFDSALVLAYFITATEQLQQRCKRENSFYQTALNTGIISSGPKVKRLAFLTPGPTS
jgi:hypothetical protein